jgi:hypothetical protein
MHKMHMYNQFLFWGQADLSGRGFFEKIFPNHGFDCVNRAAMIFKEIQQFNYHMWMIL